MKNRRIRKDTAKILYRDSNRYDARNLSVKEDCKHGYSLKTKRRIAKIINYVNIVLRRRLEMPFLGVTMTTKCSLRCKYCADLIPMYGKDACDFDFNRIIRDVNNVLSSVDKVHTLILGGGEIFLYKQLDKAVSWFANQRKILTVCLITNGTVKLSEDILKILKNPKVIVRVSNYGNVVPGRKAFVSILKANGIVVEELKRQRWYDMGQMYDRDKTEQELISTYQNCGMKDCKYIQNGKIWYCSRQRGSELGMIPRAIKSDWVSIDGHSDKLRKQIENMYKKSYVTACNYCDGNNKSQKRVTLGEQMGNKR